MVNNNYSFQWSDIIHLHFVFHISPDFISTAVISKDQKGEYPSTDKGPLSNLPEAITPTWLLQMWPYNFRVYKAAA